MYPIEWLGKHPQTINQHGITQQNFYRINIWKKKNITDNRHNGCTSTNNKTYNNTTKEKQIKMYLKGLSILILNYVRFI